jgi:hypothetical protein
MHVGQTEWSATMSKQATKTKAVSEPKIVSEPKTRSDYAKEINANYKATFDGILKMGHALIAAKDALGHGQFGEMIKHDLPFTLSTAERLMTIASDSRITNPAHVQLLPFAWGTLYELTKLKGEAFEQALSSGAINSRMTRNEAARLATDSSTRKFTHRHRQPRYQPEIVAGSSEEENDKPDALQSTVVTAQPEPTELLLVGIERLIHDLEMAVERGDIKVDIVVFASRVGTMATRLMAVADQLNLLINTAHTFKRH